MSNNTLNKNILKVFSTNAIGLVLNLLNSVLISRFLGTEYRGTYVLISTNILLLTYILGLGSNTALIFYRAKSKEIGQIMFTTSLIFAFILSLFTVILLSIIYYYNDVNFLSAFVPENLNSRFVLLICYLGLTFQLILGIFAAYFSAQKKFSELNLSKILGQTSLICSILMLSVFSFHPNKGLSIAVLVITPILLQFLPFLIRLKYFIPNTFFSFKVLKVMTLWGTVAYISGVAQFLNYKLDYWFIDYYLGDHSLGIYSLSSSLSQMLWIIPMSIGSVIFPSFINTNNNQRRKKVVNLLKVTILISLCVGGFVYLFSDYLISFVYGKEYREASVYLKILLIGSVPYATSPIISSYFLSKNLLRYNLMASFFGFLVSLSLDMYFIPIYGLVGAAWTTSLSYILTTLIVLVYFFRIERN